MITIKHFVGSLLIMLVLTACTQTEYIYSNGDYSQKEVTLAMNQVAQDVNSYLSGGKLITLTFDEEQSNTLIGTYLPTTNFYSDVDNNNILFLHSKIRTGLNAGALSALSTYTDYYWIVEKKTLFGKFYIMDF